MLSRDRFHFLPPSLGDELVANARQATLTFSRWPGEELEVRFKLSGTMPAARAAAIADGLAIALSAPLPKPDAEDEEGGELC